MRKRPNLEKRVDLHTHTSYSDGILEPAELLQLAKEKNISAIGITDHDTVEGLEEAILSGKALNIEVVPGLELSTDLDGEEIHLLGYFIDYKNSELKKYLNFFKTERLERAKRILSKLEKLGIHLKLKDVKQIAKNSPICRPHIARLMVEKQIVTSFYSAFHKYIGDGAPAAEKKIHVSPQSAIKIINDAGGFAFIAHPGNMNEDTLKRLINLGIDGIEVIHPSHKKYQQRFYRGIVSQYCLLESGGSDYHSGLRNDDENFGKYFLPYSVFEKLKNMLHSKSSFQ